MFLHLVWHDPSAALYGCEGVDHIFHSQLMCSIGDIVSLVSGRIRQLPCMLLAQPVAKTHQHVPAGHALSGKTQYAHPIASWKAQNSSCCHCCFYSHQLCLLLVAVNAACLVVQCYPCFLAGGRRSSRTCTISARKQTSHD